MVPSIIDVWGYDRDIPFNSCHADTNFFEKNSCPGCSWLVCCAFAFLPVPYLIVDTFIGGQESRGRQSTRAAQLTQGQRYVHVGELAGGPIRDWGRS